MKKMTLALVFGFVAALAGDVLAETCTPIGEGPVRDGYRRLAGTANYCDNGDGHWYFDFYTFNGSLYLDGRLIFFHVL
jgi:hypothetical protein